MYFCYTGDKRNCDGLLANNNNCFVYFFTVLFIRTEEKVNDTSLTQVAYKRKNYIRFMFFFCREVYRKKIVKQDMVIVEFHYETKKIQ